MQPKSKFMELFKTHDNDCKHQYVTVFCPYKKAPMLNQSKLFGSKMENIEKQEVSSETVMTNHEISRDINSHLLHLLRHYAQGLSVTSVMQQHLRILKRQVVVSVGS
jgi:hypothetical protein